MLSALIALATAFAIDILFGDPPNRFHPVVAMGNFIGWGTKKWNNGAIANQFWAGASLIIGGGVLFSLPWLVLGAVWQGLPMLARGILAGVLLKPVFTLRGLLRAGQEVQQALVNKDLMRARSLVGWHLVSRNTGKLSDRQVTSAAIESLAENLTDSFFAPLICFAVGGLPLAWFYRFVNTADAMIGYRTPEFEFFGKFAARLDDLLNWMPARLAGLLLVASAGLSRLDAKTAWKIMVNQHGRTSSPNAGWAMAAGAGALGVVLEKNEHYRLEGGYELPEAQDIGRTIRLVTVSSGLSLLFCGGIIFGIKSLF